MNQVGSKSSKSQEYSIPGIDKDVCSSSNSVRNLVWYVSRIQTKRSQSVSKKGCFSD